VARLTPGTSVTLTVLRDGRERDIRLSLGEMPVQTTENDGDAALEKSHGQFGLAVEPLTPDLARELEVTTRTGVVVAQVDPDGAAAEAGLQEGDVIEKVNQQSVSNAQELRAALEAANKDKPALLLVNRHGSKGFFTLSRRNG
jgi:S1-C subfamily serine protease